MKSEREVIDMVPYHLGRTRDEYISEVKVALQKAGCNFFEAAYDSAGNCITCGEAGRCPGIHAGGVPK